MPFEKFDQHNEGAYWERYFEKDRKFYDTIKEHISAFIEKDGSVGIDIGAGPGVGAKILDTLGMKTTLTGYEPSKTASDGTKLVKELEANNSGVKYNSVCEGIDSIPTPEKESLDYILALRAAHEIAESLGGKERFFEELGRNLTGLKKQGKLIIAEPQVADNFKDQTEIIDAMKKYKLERIGHSHDPSDYITDTKMREHLEEMGLELIRETTVPDDKLLAFLQEKGFKIEESPCYFYVQTYQK